VLPSHYSLPTRRSSDLGLVTPVSPVGTLRCVGCHRLVILIRLVGRVIGSLLIRSGARAGGLLARLASLLLGLRIVGDTVDLDREGGVQQPVPDPYQVVVLADAPAVGDIGRDTGGLLAAEGRGNVFLDFRGVPGRGVVSWRHASTLSCPGAGRIGHR